MKNVRPEATALAAKTVFNFNKLQETACMTCSAAFSIGVIYWAIQIFH